MSILTTIKRWIARLHRKPDTQAEAWPDDWHRHPRYNQATSPWADTPPSPPPPRKVPDFAPDTWRIR